MTYADRKVVAFGGLLLTGAYAVLGAFLLIAHSRIQSLEYELFTLRAHMAFAAQFRGKGPHAMPCMKSPPFACTANTEGALYCDHAKDNIAQECVSGEWRDAQGQTF